MDVFLQILCEEMMTMEYRKLPHGGENISIIGFGNSSLGESDEKEMEATIAEAVEKGVNYFDMAAGHASAFRPYGTVIGSGADRKKVYYQVHFGADYTTGQYGWTLNLDDIKKSINWQLENLKTDYIDFGFIHCIDEEADLQKATDAGTIDYIKELKKQGVINHIGLSTHTPGIAGMVMDMNIIDVLMFSINPAYDYNHGDYAFGSGNERYDLYRRCETEGVGITVMKPFCGGQLLDGATSPFGVAMSEYQCIQYALDRPGVMTVLPGCRNRQDLRKVLGYLDASKEERDYSAIGSYTPKETKGACVYCNHCQPCPAGLNVGLINKYYDLSMARDILARDHYMNLEKTAKDCIKCGHCDSRCPFGVNQTGRMEEIAAYFGK